MIVSKSKYSDIMESLADNGLYYCIHCEEYFIVRNTNDGYINERVCPCCGVCSEDGIEAIEEMEE